MDSEMRLLREFGGHDKQYVVRLCEAFALLLLYAQPQRMGTKLDCITSSLFQVEMIVFLYHRFHSTLLLRLDCAHVVHPLLQTNFNAQQSGKRRESHQEQGSQIDPKTC